MPLNVPLIFSKDSSPEILVQVLKNESAYGIELEQKQIGIESRTIVQRKIPFTEMMFSSKKP